MAEEADWSQLPKDLLTLISQRIHAEIDLIRFRSVCSNWRSSSIPNHHNILPFKFALLQYGDESIKYNDNIIDSINNINTSFCYLSKRRIFLVKPPPQQQQQQQQQTLVRPWLMRITQSSSGKAKLFHPHLTYPQSQLPQQQQQNLVFPHMLNFSKLSSVHLGTDFIIDEDDITFQNVRRSYLYPQTVIAVTCHGKNPLILATLSTLNYYSHRQVLFRGRDKRWMPISNITTAYGDICLFKGRFYVVNGFGRTVTVGPDSSIELAAQPLHGGGRLRKLLVESKGELLLLDMNVTSFSFTFDFYELDEKEKKWVMLKEFDEKEKKRVKLKDFDEKHQPCVKLRNFEDRVFFMGSGCSFSASASDLCIPKGNCVIFFDESVLTISNMVSGNRIFHLDQYRLSSVFEYPEYLNLFLPPQWILNI